jgi:hypothetical protein
MLTHLPIGRAVIPSLRCLNAWELEDDSAFRGSSFQVFVGTVKSENLNLMPGESR